LVRYRELCAAPIIVRTDEYHAGLPVIGKIVCESKNSLPDPIRVGERRLSFNSIRFGVQQQRFQFGIVHSL
jgi:hypothetical protein